MVKSENKTHFLNKIAIISTLLCFLVTLTYYFNTDNFSSIDISSLEKFKSKIVEISKMATPGLFMIAGCLYFRHYKQKYYFQKIAHRIPTFVLPFLIWGVINTLFCILFTYASLPQLIYDGNEFKLSVSNVLLGVFFYKYGEQFWHLFDLIIFCLISPLLYYLIKDKIVGVVVVVEYLVLLYFDIGIPTVVFKESNSILFFVIGGYLGLHFYDNVVKFKTTDFLIVLSSVLLTACVVLQCVMEVLPVVLNVFYIIENISLFFLINLINVDKLGDTFTSSFFLFAIHTISLPCMTELFTSIFPKTQLASWILYFVILAVHFVLIVLIAKLMKRFIPKTYKVLVGDKLK